MKQQISSLGIKVWNKGIHFTLNMSLYINIFVDVNVELINVTIQYNTKHERQVS